MHIFGNFWQNRRLAPPPRGILDPPLVTDSGEFQTNDIHEIITSHSGLLYILYVGRLIFNVSLFKVMNLM